MHGYNEGRLRALEVTTLARSPAMPELPTIAESGLPGFDLTTWFGVMAPARTPPEIVAKPNAEIVRALNAKEMRERLEKMGAEAPAHNKRTESGRNGQCRRMQMPLELRLRGPRAGHAHCALFFPDGSSVRVRPV